MVPDEPLRHDKRIADERRTSRSGSHTEIAAHFEAPYVLANLSGGGVFLEKGAVVAVGAYAQKIQGLPKDAKATKHASLRSMLPFLPERAEDEDVWAVAFDLAKRDAPFPTTGSKTAPSRATRAATPKVR